MYSSEQFVRPFLVKSGQIVSLNSSNPHTSSYLSSGFSTPESWGTWSDGNKAEMKFSIDKPKTKYINVILSTSAWITKGHETFKVTASHKNKIISEYFFTKPDLIDWEFSFPAKDLESEKNIIIEFRFTNGTTPLFVGQSADTRTLGLGLHKFQVFF